MLKGKYNVVSLDEGNFIMGFFSGKLESFRKFHNETDFIIYLDTGRKLKQGNWI